MNRIVLDPTHQPIDYAQIDIRHWNRVHFIGIGGAGMSVLAEMLLEEGVAVLVLMRTAMQRRSVWNLLARPYMKVRRLHMSMVPLSSCIRRQLSLIILRL